MGKDYKSPLEDAVAAIQTFSFDEVKNIVRTIKQPKPFCFLKKIKKNELCFEIFAYYEFLMLLHLVTVDKVPAKEVADVQFELERAVDQSLGKKDFGIRKKLMGGNLSYLVGCYVRDDSSLIEVNEPEFLSLAKVIGFHKRLDDFILKTYVISFLRILGALGYVKQGKVRHYFNIFSVWIVHANQVGAFRNILKEVNLEYKLKLQ